MIEECNNPVLELTRRRFRAIVQENHLLDADVTVLAKPLTPEEAIGRPGRRDFPIIIGKERVIESSVLGSKGHAFTDAAQEFMGILKDVLHLDLKTSQNRAIFVATLNAVLGHLKMATATVHCKDNDPEECARKIASDLRAKHGEAEVGLIGLNPAIAERLVDTFGAAHVRISDLNGENVGGRRFGVDIWDGTDRTEDLVDASRTVIVTGTTLVNGTFDRVWRRIQDCGIDYTIYGVTAAGVCALMGLSRICPLGRDG